MALNLRWALAFLLQRTRYSTSYKLTYHSLNFNDVLHMSTLRICNNAQRGNAIPASSSTCNKIQRSALRSAWSSVTKNVDCWEHILMFFLYVLVTGVLSAEVTTSGLKSRWRQFYVPKWRLWQMAMGYRFLWTFFPVHCSWHSLLLKEGRKPNLSSCPAPFYFTTAYREPSGCGWKSKTHFVLTAFISTSIAFFK